MIRTLLVGLLLVALASDCGAETRGETRLSGWQGMRVIAQEGSPGKILAVDVNGDARQELFVVNTRQSRLDVYSWVPKEQRTPPTMADADRPNELPLAQDWKHQEIGLDELPVDLVVGDVDADGKPELVVLTTPSNKVLMYKLVGTDEWKLSETWNLLPGTPAGRDRYMLLRRLSTGRSELLVSFDQGIQTLALQTGNRPAWLSPREMRGRLDWFLTDLDGDSDLDLVEWTSVSRQNVRWYPCEGDKLMSAQVLHDQAIQQMQIMEVLGRPSEIALLGGVQEGILRRYSLGRGETSALGKQESLPMAGGTSVNWCGLMLDNQRALVAADPAQPRLRVQPLDDSGWLAEQSYPSVGNVTAVAAPLAQPGTLLLWVKDAADLHVSRWEGARLTFPQPMPSADAAADRKTLALASVASTTWWVQRVGVDLDLYVWEPGQSEATRTRYPGAGANIAKVQWLGGQRLLIQEQYAAGARLLTLVDGASQTRDLTDLAKLESLGEFRVVPTEQGLRPARLTGGVLQWLSENVQPTDQVMLADGQRMASFVPLPGGEAWALEEGGVFVHRLKPDDAGILRPIASTRLPGGIELRLDPVVGLVLVDQDRILRLHEGQPWELKLLETLDSRVGRPSGVKEATIHRMLTADCTGDGVKELVLCDDVRHQLTVLARSDQGLAALSSWPVFEDQAYPYGGGLGFGLAGGQVSEPRAIEAFDADGDSLTDLALLCHDRLLIYLARDLP